MGNTTNSGADCQSAVESQQTGTIYLLTCTVNGKKYVGQTRQKLGRRISQHKSDSNKKRATGIAAAIRNHGWKNFTVEVLETCPVEKLDEREIFWIRELNTKAPNGYNLTDGGDGGRGCSPSVETRAKLSKALKGRPAHNKGAKHTPEARKKMSKAQTGKKKGPLSPETRAKLSKAHKGQPAPNKGMKHTAETCAKISAANKGKKRKPHSPETKAKISAHHKATGQRPPSQKGRKRTKETCAKISESHKGIHPSEETRAKRSASMKAYWERKKALENGGDT